MTFAQGFLLVSSMLIIFLMGFHAIRNHRRHGAICFFLLMVFALFWSFTSFMEEIVSTEHGLLWWRNLQQIGVFGTPFISLCFAIRYTKNEKGMPYAYAVLVVQIISVLLIFTDGWHHLMRSSIQYIDHETYGLTLIVESTALGLTLVTFNFMLTFIAIVILFDFRRKTDSRFKKQTSIIIWSFALVFIAAFLKMAILNDYGIYLSISVLYIPGALLMFYGLFRYDFLSVSLVGRDIIFSLIDKGIIITDKNKMITDINPTAKKWVKTYFKHDPVIIGKNIDHMFSNIIRDFKIDISDNESVFDISIPDSEKTHLSIHRIPVRQSKRTHTGFVYILSDVTKEVSYQNELQYLATHDRLTNLTNRVTFENMYERTNMADKQMAMILTDIDDFKTINDTYGHGFGDEILKNLADVLKEITGKSATIGRLGGEEFGLFIPNTPQEEAWKIAEKIRKTIESKKNQTHTNTIVRYTVSLGIATTEGTIMPFERLRNNADQALYLAKKNGKNKSVAFKNE